MDKAWEDTCWLHKEDIFVIWYYKVDQFRRYLLTDGRDRFLSLPQSPFSGDNGSIVSFEKQAIDLLNEQLFDLTQDNNKLYNE